MSAGKSIGVEPPGRVMACVAGVLSCLASLGAEPGNAPDDVLTLLSHNGGRGPDLGLGYAYEGPGPNNPEDTMPGSSEFGNRLVNGERHGGNWHDPVGTDRKKLTVDFAWPESQRLVQVRVKAKRFPKVPGSVEVWGRGGAEAEWQELGSIPVASAAGEGRSWFELTLPAPRAVSEVRLTFRQGDSTLYYIDEVELLGQPGWVAAGPFPLVEEGDRLFLVKDNEAVARIVIAAEADDAVRDAARLLQSKLYAMTGAGLPIVTDADELSGAFIAVGPSGATEAMGVPVPQAYFPERERAVVRRDGRGIAVLGNDAMLYQGTRRAVYLFLEELGWGWYAPVAHWEVVPSMSDLSVADLDLSETPAFYGRKIMDFTRRWFAGSKARNADAIDPVAWGLGGIDIHSTHSLYDLVPPDKYFDDHPEYFALVDGERTREKAQICFSNEDVQRIVADTVIAQLEARPARVAASIGANDNGGFCQCDECREMGRTPSDQSLAFANIVAERVREVLPDRYVIFYVYWFTQAAPTHVKEAAPGVMIEWINASCPVHAIDDPESPSGRKALANLAAWQETGVLMNAYSYYIPEYKRDNYLYFPWVAGEVALRDLRLFREHGFLRSYYETGKNVSTVENYPFRWVLYYVVSRGMERPDLTTEEILAPACERLFGPAGEAMVDFYLSLSGSLGESDVDRRMWNMPDVHEAFHPDDVAEARSHLARAMAAVAEPGVDPGQVRRLHDVLRAWGEFETLYREAPRDRPRFWVLYEGRKFESDRREVDAGYLRSLLTIEAGTDIYYGHEDAAKGPLEEGQTITLSGEDELHVEVR